MGSSHNFSEDYDTPENIRDRKNGAAKLRDQWREVANDLDKDISYIKRLAKCRATKSALTLMQIELTRLNKIVQVFAYEAKTGDRPDNDMRRD